MLKCLYENRFADEEIQKDIQLWPFKVVQKQAGKPFIQVSYLGETKEFAPEEISAMVLTKMKKTAEDYLGTTVTDAVITCPGKPQSSPKYEADLISLSIFQ